MTFAIDGPWVGMLRRESIPNPYYSTILWAIIIGRHGVGESMGAGEAGTKPGETNQLATYEPSREKQIDLQHARQNSPNEFTNGCEFPFVSKY